MLTYDMMVQRVAKAGLDHKLVLIDGLDDPVGQDTVPDAPLVVSSDPDKELSDYYFKALRLRAFVYFTAFGLM